MSETLWKVVDLQTVFTPDKPGLLAIAELAKLAPGFFPNDAAPRVYWIKTDPSEWSMRGGHYHPEGGKREMIVALAGQIEFDLHAASGCGQVTLSGRKQQGLLIPNGVWHGVRLSPNAVLLSIASTLYAPNESITAKPCGCP